MIKSNMMPPKDLKKAASKAKPTVKVKAAKKGGSKGSPIGCFLYMLLLSLMGFVAYISLMGIPSALRPYIPLEIVEFLGLGEEAPPVQAPREPSAPKLTARGIDPSEPSVPSNGSVEEIVKTMRPDLYFNSRTPVEYKDQTIANRIPYQKQAFHIMLSTFYNATPDGIGYLDLAYQAPNFYFARAIAMDSRTRTSYMDNLKSRVVDLYVTDSLTVRDGNIEFIVYGGIQQPNFSELRGSQQLVPRAKINSEIIALRNLALTNQVRLAGIENPIEEQVGSYRRILLKVNTDADYPSLLNFADALQKSEIAFGVQQFVSRPAGPEKMQSSIEFVLYSALK